MEPKYEDIEIRIGTYDGHPIMSTITAEEQREAAKYGLTLDDLFQFHQYRDWQQDC